MVEMTDAERATASWVTEGLIASGWLYGLFIVRKATQQVTQSGVQTNSADENKNKIIITP